jgi:DNA modification methylase
MRNEILVGDALERLKEIPDGSVQCCVTSPPYWGLRNYQVDGQLGLENTPEEYVSKLVTIFREVKRVLRKDGTLWLNLGDSYNTQPAGNTKPRSGGGNGRGRFKMDKGKAQEAMFKRKTQRLDKSLKPKDLVGIPWRVALALQADGWWLRSDIIWSKPNPMPESVTDRPTKAHEYIFLLTKSAKYYYDADAVREPNLVPLESVWRPSGYPDKKNGETQSSMRSMKSGQDKWNPLGRNLRSVWTITTNPYSGAHFATFPPEIPERCIRAGTSERGCCQKCGSPLERITEKEGATTIAERGYDTHQLAQERGMLNTSRSWKGGDVPVAKYTTIGWRPSCTCNVLTKPCLVLDPFAGSGTTIEITAKLGRDYIGIELNEDYVKKLINPRMSSYKKFNEFFNHE